MSENFEIIKSPDDEDVIYLKLKVSTDKSVRQIRLHDLIEYAGADIYFDFNEKGEILGIEILN